MSQVTIIDDVLDFTELNASASDNPRHADLGQMNSEPERFAPKSLNAEEQRVVHELTSILISGHLPS